MPTPATYRAIAARLHQRRRWIFTIGLGYLTVWLAYAITSATSGFVLPGGLHTSIFIYGAWILPVVGWFLILFGFFGPGRTELAPGRRGRVFEAARLALAWYAALFLTLWFVLLLVGPILLWSPSVVSRLFSGA